MRLLQTKTSFSNITAELLVCVVSEGELSAKTAPKRSGNTPSFASINTHFKGELSKTLQKASFKASAGSTFLFTLANPQIGSLLLFVWNETGKSPFDVINLYRTLGSAIQSAAQKLGVKKITLSTGAMKLEKEHHLTSLIEGVLLSGYEYTDYKSERKTPHSIEELSLISDKKIQLKYAEQAVNFCHATSFARDLVNMPPNDCTPAHIVKVSKKLAETGKIKIQVFDKAQLTKMGANLLLAVSLGSTLPPYLIKLVYSPKNKTSRTKVISIVGKGVTYDTGGYSLKPSDSMIGMKGDMGGAAAVLGVMKIISKARPNCEVRGYIPTTENMINGEATRVGDIVTGLSGKTVEILNTDAEGRLILADALTMACNDKADVIIDVATLTGGCMVALGLLYAGLFTDNDKLARDITEAGELAGERFWRLPLAPEYADSLKSKVADLKNIGAGRWASPIIGGLFLKEFVTNCTWAHLDIAGPSDAEKDAGFIKTGGVGFGVRTLARYILSQ